MSEENKLLVQQFFDGSLDKKSEKELFTLLANDEDTREFFKSFNKLKNIIQDDIEDFPFELEERIFNKIKNTKVNKNFISFLLGNQNLTFAYAIIILFMLITAYFFLQIENYKDEIRMVNERISDKDRVIEVLLNNSFPVIDVKPDYTNEVIIKPNI